MNITYDGKTFTLTNACWTGTYPIKELPDRVALYRIAQARFPVSANGYNEAIKQLEKLAAEIGA